ncbi:hypothetical protein OO015_13855 (plasmid) [Thermomicrobium sp. 4228-Ro]|uniref:hypothetical protein n=1 Tax=Thermomicrobium sp. 4228-Ro TaxID=2993937 RepID=UPI0022491ABE|nr:hypothetical protein [Thermomicrobium sp. 4228-Ro]MCX2728570.1 hypothetical protein [Thermomicrobium sp. 4228-Ro]
MPTWILGDSTVSPDTVRAAAQRQAAHRRYLDVVPLYAVGGAGLPWLSKGGAAGEAAGE